MCSCHSSCCNPSYKVNLFTRFEYSAAVLAQSLPPQGSRSRPELLPLLSHPDTKSHMLSGRRHSIKYINLSASRSGRLQKHTLHLTHSTMDLVRTLPLDIGTLLPKLTELTVTCYRILRQRMQCRHDRTSSNKI
jgi:hypothetical protein